MKKYIKATLTIRIPWDSLTYEEKKEAPEALKMMGSELQEESEAMKRKGVETSLKVEEVEE